MLSCCRRRCSWGSGSPPAPVVLGEVPTAGGTAVTGRNRGARWYRQDPSSASPVRPRRPADAGSAAGCATARRPLIATASTNAPPAAVPGDGSRHAEDRRCTGPDRGAPQVTTSSYPLAASLSRRLLPPGGLSARAFTPPAALPRPRLSPGRGVTGLRGGAARRRHSSDPARPRAADQQRAPKGEPPRPESAPLTPTRSCRGACW